MNQPGAKKTWGGAQQNHPEQSVDTLKVTLFFLDTVEIEAEKAGFLS